MLDSDNPESEFFVKEIKSQETEMRDTLLSNNSIEEDPNNRLDYLQPEIQISLRDIYTTCTGAQLTTYNAYNALRNFCMSLPKDMYGVSTPDIFVGPTLKRPCTGSRGGLSFDWIGNIQLPPLVPMSCRFVNGPPSSSKRLAMKRACLDVMKKLHEAGELTDHLQISRSKGLSGAVLAELVKDEGVQKLIAEIEESPDIISREILGETTTSVRSYPIKLPLLFDEGWASGMGYLVLAKVYAQKDDFLDNLCDHVLDFGFLVPTPLTDAHLKDHVVCVDRKKYSLRISDQLKGY